MDDEYLVLIITTCASAGFGYYSGIRMERMRARRERRAIATASIIQVVGLAIKGMHEELAKERCDEFESTARSFSHLDFLDELTSAYYMSRPMLDAKASGSVEEMISCIRRYCHTKLMLACNSLTYTEVDWPGPLESLMRDAIKLQDTLERFNR